MIFFLSDLNNLLFGITHHSIGSTTASLNTYWAKKKPMVPRLLNILGVSYPSSYVCADTVLSKPFGTSPLEISVTKFSYMSICDRTS